jgi:exopolysaccharide biosynthesis polyprenyl glycosylphosphotransferase
MNTSSSGARTRRAQNEVRVIRDRSHRDAHVESTIPPWFLWAADAFAMLIALAIDVAVSPSIQHLVAPGGPWRVDWLSWLGFPGANLQSFPFLRESVGLLLVTVPVALVAIGLARGYEPVERLSRARLYLSAAFGPLAGLSAFVLIVFTLRYTEWSRVFLFTYTFLSVVALVTHRALLRTYKLRRTAAGRYACATAFVGRPDDVREVLDRLPSDASGGRYRAVGYFTTGEPVVAPAALAKLGSVDEIAATLVHTPIDLIVVVMPDGKAPWLGDVLTACDYLRVAVQIIPSGLPQLLSTLQDLRTLPGASAVPLPGVLLRPFHVDSGALVLKRLFDVIVATTLLVLLSPVFLLVALLIKMTTPKEDIFYRWRVIGYQGRPFTGYKFTTMVADADAQRADLQHLNEMTGPVFKIKNDPRITTVGKVLRKFSLNELPQLWSVVVGDMSLVGPRPAGSWEIGGYEDWHKRKLAFRPGMTCLWQVRGRNKISSFDDWVRMDLEYIDNWSLWLDARILMRTAWVVVAGSGS